MISRIRTNQAEADQGEGEKNAEKQQGAMLKTRAGSYFNSLQNPVRGQIQEGGDEREVEDLQLTFRVRRSGSQLPDTRVIGNQ